MRVGGCALLALFVVLACGASCGGGGGDDQPADAAPPDADEGACPVPPGVSNILTQMRFLPSGQGFDLDGDEVIDNVLGGIPQSALDSIHAGLDEGIAVGEWTMILHVTDIADPPPANDPDAGFIVFTGLDADTPADPSNNYNGEGEFFIRVGEFDLDCNPTNAADEASIENHVMTATSDALSFELAQGSGTLMLVNGTYVLTFSDDYYTSTGLYGGMTTLCSMSQLPFPGDTPGSVLDAFANDLSPYVSVDMDLDGDGLEEVIGDGVTVLQCIDGDGTVIPGPTCACDARIADAYSLAFSTEAIAATIVGVR